MAEFQTSTNNTDKLNPEFVMETINNSLRAHSAQEADLSLSDSELERLREMVKPKVDVDINYHQYISESDELRESILDYVYQGGKILKVDSGCASGKTYFFMQDLQKACLGRKRVVLLVPNTIQAEQVKESYPVMDPFGNMIWPIALTGTSTDQPYTTNGSICSVYDSVERLREIGGMFEDLILVVDESHLLFSSKSYRAQAIKKIETLASEVIAAWGTVILMSGTFNVLGGWPCDVMYHCHRIDAQGREIKNFSGDEIEFYYRANYNCTKLQVVYDLIKDKLATGQIPFVRFNNKRLICALQTQLAAEGLNVCVLTSDQKGRHQEQMAVYLPNGTVKMDTKMVYDSEAFRMLVEESTLPYADVYLVTSMVEVGTNIKYIKDINGSNTQPENLVPIFVVNRFDEMDLDDIVQLFARPRFKYNSAVIFADIITEEKIKEKEAKEKNRLKQLPVCFKQ